MQNYLESRMLGNLHVRFGVGAGVKTPGLHHFILARQGQTYARLRFNAGPGAEIELPVSVDYSRPFTGSDPDAWEQEYLANVQAEISPRPLDRRLDSLANEESMEEWRESWFDYLPDDDSTQGISS